MNTHQQAAKGGQATAAVPDGQLQRTCTCGTHTTSGACPTCQQGRGGLLVGPPGDAHEREASRVATIVTRGGAAPVLTHDASALLRRAEPPPPPSSRDPSADERRKNPGSSLPDLGFNEPKKMQRFELL